MKERVAKDVIKKIAKREGKSESEIREEMKQAILGGFLNKETRHKWDSLFGIGRLPSPEEFIMKMAETVTEQRNINILT
jgi:hypothetical protein